MKKIKLVTEIDLDWVEFAGDIVAYKKTVSVNGSVERELEGIASIKDIETSVNGDFPESKHLLFYSEPARHFCLNNVLGYKNNLQKLHEFAIENPYTLIKEGYPIDKLELLNFNYGSSMKNDINGNPIPQMLHFDYMARLTDANYDLDKVLEILKQRDDVFPSNNGIIVEGELKVSKIPYYNASEEEKHHIDFVWKPSEKDIQKHFKTSNTGLMSKQCEALQSVFHLKKK